MPKIVRRQAGYPAYLATIFTYINHIYKLNKYFTLKSNVLNSINYQIMCNSLIFNHIDQYYYKTYYSIIYSLIYSNSTIQTIKLIK